MKNITLPSDPWTWISYALAALFTGLVTGLYIQAFLLMASLVTIPTSPPPILPIYPEIAAILPVIPRIKPQRSVEIPTGGGKGKKSRGFMRQNSQNWKPQRSMGEIY